MSHRHNECRTVLTEKRKEELFFCCTTKMLCYLWYEDTDIRTTSKQLETRFHEYMDTGGLAEARGVFEYRRYLAEAAKDVSLRTKAMGSVVRGYCGT